MTVTRGAKTLVAGTDYTVGYANNINAGTATVTITGIGDYTGTKAATFRIVPKKSAITRLKAARAQGHGELEEALGCERLPGRLLQEARPRASSTHP